MSDDTFGSAWMAVFSIFAVVFAGLGIVLIGAAVMHFTGHMP